MLKKWNILFFGLLLLFPFKINAACDYKRLADLSKIASNVNLSYSYLIGENNEPKFFVNISNLTNDIYMVDYDGNIISGDFEKEFEYYSGANMQFVIYSNDVNCHGEKIMTKYLKIPKFNPYFNTEECKQNPNFKYCDLWGSSNVGIDKFEQELKLYVNNKDDSEDKSNNNSNIGEKSHLLYFVVICTVFLLFGLIFLLKKRR